MEIMEIVSIQSGLIIFIIGLIWKASAAHFQHKHLIEDVEILKEKDSKSKERLNEC